MLAQRYQKNMLKCNKNNYKSTNCRHCPSSLERNSKK